MKKVLKIIGILLLILPFALWFGGRSYLSLSVADYSGDLQISGLQQPIEITFDEKGIPQVWAKNDADMYFALGWLHASERLFQMELTRRMVYGELSELLGASTFEIDLKQRQIGFARRAIAWEDSIDSQSKNWLEAYCNGINVWLNHKSVLPPEFVLMSFSPREWKIADCLAIGVYQTWYSHTLVDKDIDYDALIKTFGEDLLPILQEYKHWSPPTVHSSFAAAFFEIDPYPFRMSTASNSWVISPEKSASGAAIHASDPHLRIDQIPGFWYIAGLHSESGTNVIGTTAPGMPLVTMGHNDSIAYAFTVSAVDLVDYYRYQRHPQNAMEVKTASGHQPLIQRMENIQVAGEDTMRRAPIFETADGLPVISEDSTSILSLHWAGFDMNPAKVLAAAFQLHRTTNFEAFRRCVTQFGALDANWTYSDRRGNIGYQLGTPIPLRDYQDTFSNLDGSDVEKRWKGYAPLAQTPYMLNPAEGWLVTCNNQVVSEQWPNALPGFYDPYRIFRADQLLSKKAQFDRSDSEIYQLDIISGRSLRWKLLMAQGAEKMGDANLANDIRAWDGSMPIDEEMPTLFILWWEYLAKPLFEDDLGEDWESGKLIMEEVLTANMTRIIDDQRTPEKVEDIVDASAASLEFVLKEYGNVKYGEFSKITYWHPLSRAPGVGDILDSWLGLNRGPFPAEGDRGTLNANFNFWLEDKKELYSAVGPSMRYVLDWADIDGFTIHGSFGQSGNPLSPHYGDHVDLMRDGSRWIVPFSKEAVYGNHASVLILRP